MKFFVAGDPRWGEWFADCFTYLGDDRQRSSLRNLVTKAFDPQESFSAGEIIRMKTLDKAMRKQRSRKS